MCGCDSNCKATCDCACHRDRAAELEIATLRGLLERWWNEGRSLGASHPHFAAYFSHPEDLWLATKAALAQKAGPE